MFILIISEHGELLDSDIPKGGAETLEPHLEVTAASSDEDMDGDTTDKPKGL